MLLPERIRFFHQILFDSRLKVIEIVYRGLNNALEKSLKVLVAWNIISQYLYSVHLHPQFRKMVLFHRLLIQI